MNKNKTEPNIWTSGIVNPKGRMSVGVSSFSKITSKEYDYTFIDKTLFIKEVLDSGDDVILITRPRRFGKTLNMSMLHQFLAEKNAKDNLFKGLAIEKTTGSYLAERGKRPVIYLSLKDIKARTWQKAFQEIQILLAGVVNNILQTCSMSLLTVDNQDILTKLRNKKANDTESESALKILTELLALQYGEKPWVLIDEYDTPMQTAYQYGFYNEMRDLIGGFLGKALKDNEYLHKSVITGIVRIAKEDIFSGLNNLGTYGVLDEEFSNYFGFTQEQVDALLDQKGLSRHKEVVKHWYNGYQFGQDTIYNPWSIINFVGSKGHKPKLYWVNTSSNHLVHTLLAKAGREIKQGLQELLNKESNYTTLQNLQTYTPLKELKNNAKNIWGLLLASGYITVSSCQKVSGSSDHKAVLRIPNEEVRSVYGDLVQNWLHGVGSTSGYNLLDYLLSGDLVNFSEDFATFFHESASYFDIGTNAPEKFYHGFILGMVQHLRDQYIVLSQKESGGGRYDLALEPKEKNKPGFLFEFKRCASSKGSIEEIKNKLKGPAIKALNQIKSQEYATQLFASGVKTVHALGLAFGGKEVYVVFESLQSR